MIKNVVEKNKNIDVNEDKMNKLKEMFPNCFNINGEFDISVFEEELKANISIVKEGYGLNFLGKNYAKYIASLETETILVPDEENNNKVENKNSENIYISGDNIDALKHLVKSYSGQIKCIYIDPPYNTGSDGFVYNDKFNLSVEKLMDILDINEDEAKRIYSMTNTKSNSHSAWMTFMYPRLYIAKQLLSENGVIFISIDDNEQSQLKLLCDSVFGEENILGMLPTIMNLKGNNDEYAFSGTHEYTIVYSKNKEKSSVYQLEIDDDETDAWDEDEIGYYKKGANLKSTGVNAPREKRPNLFFPIYVNKEDNSVNVIRKTKDDIEIYPITNGKEMSWRWSKEKFIKQANDIIVSINDTDVSLYKKQRPSLGDLPTSKPKSILYKPEYSSGNGTERIKSLFGFKAFSNPKPVSLLYDLLQIGVSNNDIVLDFFGGSSTTADAVMQLNTLSNNKRNIKYILVQLQELCDTKSEAYKNGYRTIDEIGQERIRKAAKKIKEETNADIDYGFKHYIIKDVNTNTLDKLEKFEPNYVISDGSILDEFGINAVLTTWMNEDGYGLTDKYEKLELEDYTAYKCQNTIYLLNWNISDLFIKALIEKYEKEENFDCNRIVMLGYSFTLNEIQTLKDNLQQVKNIKSINVEVITRY